MASDTSGAKYTGAWYGSSRCHIRRATAGSRIVIARGRHKRTRLAARRSPPTDDLASLEGPVLMVRSQARSHSKRARSRRRSAREGEHQLRSLGPAPAVVQVAPVRPRQPAGDEEAEAHALLCAL